MACILMLLIFNVKLLKMADTYGTFMILFIFPSYRFHRQSVQTSVWSDHYFLFRFSLSSFYNPDSKVQGPTRAHLGLTGPRWAPCWPHDLAIWEYHELVNKPQVEVILASVTVDCLLLPLLQMMVINCVLCLLLLTL